MSDRAGTLYVVATPIGNLGDLSPRALETLKMVSVVAAEDTRHSARLLRHFAVATALTPLHEHNERRAAPALVTRLLHGEDVALISDAGTPLFSDPGFQLVRAARDAGIRVVPVPGPSAITAALSAAGLSLERFAFEGFLPAKGAARRGRLRELATETRTLVVFEAPHRVAATLADMVEVFGAERPAAITRELTKVFEEVRDGTLGGLRDWLAEHPHHCRGEFVLVVQGLGRRAVAPDLEPEDERVLRLLLAQLPARTAAALAAEITGRKKNAMYRRALELAVERDDA